MSKGNDLHGVMAEFRTPKDLLAAIEAAKGSGYTKMDAYTPYPIEKVIDALGFHHTKVPLICLIGAMVGMVGVFGLATWVSVIEYPLNIGGRPHFSWPAFVPVTFEGAVLIGGLSTAIGMFLLNGFPAPYHPVFNVPRFVEASKFRYFLCIESTDPKFDVEKVRELLKGTATVEVNDVPE
jgi:hypothetical protein